MQLLEKILQFIGNKLVDVILSICSAVEKTFTYLSDHEQHKIDKEKNKEDKKYSEKIEDVANNGSIEDLLDLKRKK